MIGANLGLIVAAEPTSFRYEAPQAPARMSGWAVWGQVFYFLVVFAVVIGLTYLVTRALASRTRFSRQSAHLRVIDELPLGSGRSVLLLDCVDRVLIVGVAERSLSAMGQIDEPTLVEQLRSTPEPDAPGLTDFRDLLQRALKPDQNQPSLERTPLAHAQRNAQGLRDLLQRLGKQRMD